VYIKKEFLFVKNVNIILNPQLNVKCVNVLRLQKQK